MLSCERVIRDQKDTSQKCISRNAISRETSHNFFVACAISDANFRGICFLMSGKVKLLEIINSCFTMQYIVWCFQQRTAS